VSIKTIYRDTKALQGLGILSRRGGKFSGAWAIDKEKAAALLSERR